MFLPPSKHSQNTFNGYLDNILIVQCTVYIYQGWEFAHRFSERIAHFWWATWVNRSWSFIFGERPEQFAHIAHFWWAHRSPKKREWANCSFEKEKKTLENILKNKIFLAKIFWANRSFSWAICSRSLICLERSEQIALQSLIWFERNEQMSEWAMSEWANSQPWHIYNTILVIYLVHCTVVASWLTVFCWCVLTLLLLLSETIELCTILSALYWKLFTFDIKASLAQW